MKSSRALLVVATSIVCVVVLLADAAWARSSDAQIPLVGRGDVDMSSALKMLGVLTGLAVAPFVLLTATSFVRMVVVFSLLRTALGTQNAPPQQVLIGLALFMTAAVMAPVAKAVYNDGIDPYLSGRYGGLRSYHDGIKPLRAFMLQHTRESDLALLYDVTKTEYPKAPSSVHMHLLLPAFVLSELHTGFEMGAMILVPFLVVDLIVASLLMAMGMVMLPPTIISLPLKLCLFVVSDGWALLVGSLLRSFA